MGDTERPRLGDCATGIATVDRSGRLDGPAIGISGSGTGGFGWGGFNLCYGGIEKCNQGHNNSEAHFRSVSTSLEPELVIMYYSSS